MTNNISLCMIIRNEERNLRRCLQSIYQWVSEIIIVDTGSNDQSLAIAKEFGAKVQTHPWHDDFSEVRNVSLEHANGDWILFLDADEELAPESYKALNKAVVAPEIEGYFVNINNYLGNEGWGETCPDLVFRLFRNRKEYRFRGAIHEQIAHVILENNPHAKFRIAEGLTLFHYGYLDREIESKDKKKRNLEIIERELAQNPNDRLLRYHYGVELFRLERYQEAATELIRAANGIDPNTIYLPKLLRYIVMSQHAAGQPEEALKTAHLGLQFFPDYADLYYYSGLISLEQKKYSSAREYFQQATTMPEQQPQYASFGGLRGFRSYYHLGTLFEIFYDFEEALKYYVLSLKDNPNFTHALDKIVTILDPIKEPEYTEECINKVFDFCTPEAHFLIGEIYFHQGAFLLALEHFDYAQDLMTCPELKIWRAICLMQASRYLEALILLDQFQGDSSLYPISKINKLFCYWLQDKPQKTAGVYLELEKLGLNDGTLKVLSLFVDTPFYKNKGGTVHLEKEEMSLFLEMIQRVLAGKKAAQALDILDHIDPSTLTNFSFELGLLFYHYGMYEKALSLFQAYVSEKHDAESYFFLAEIYRETGSYYEAEQCYRHALEESPDVPKHYIRLISLYEQWKSSLRED